MGGAYSSYPRVISRNCLHWLAQLGQWQTMSDEAFG